MVITNHILEHIPEDVKAIKEVNRVIKKEKWQYYKFHILKN